MNLSVSQDKLVIGPYLPYDEEFSIVPLDITNPSQYDTEVYVLELDKKYIEEEK